MTCGGCARARAMREAQMNRGVGAQAPKVVVPAGKKGACTKMYDELSLLDRKIIQLHRKFKWSEKGYKLAQTQKVVRMWIRELPNGCPNEDDLNEVKEFVNGDYGKYFKSDVPAQ